MTGPAMPPDLDRLLAAATVPDMAAGLIDRIVAEAQRPDRIAMPVATPRHAQGRRWTRRGVRTGIVAVGLMLATAVAAAFGGGVVSVAKIRAAAQHVVERIRHPFHHAAPVAVSGHPVVHRMTVPAGAIRVTRYGAVPGPAPRPMRAPPVPDRRFAVQVPMTAPIARAVHLHPVAHPSRPAPLRLAHRFDRAVHRDHPIMARGTRIVPGSAARSAARAETAVPRADNAQPDTRRDGRLRADGGPRFDGARWQNPQRLGEGAGGPRGLGWRRRMQGGGTAMAPRWRNPAGPGWGFRPMRSGRPGGGRRPRRF